MADLEQARAMLRMAHKDFNALIGMHGNPLFADEVAPGFTAGRGLKQMLHARADAARIIQSS